MLAALIVFAFGANGCHKAGPTSYHPYGVQHAKLHFEYAGPIRGYEDELLDSFGNLEAHFVHSDIVTDKGINTMRIYSVRRGAFVTTVDSARLVENSFTDPRIDSLLRLKGSIPSPEEEFSNYFSKGGFRHIGDTTILGLKSQIWQFAEQPTYLYCWNGLLIGRTISVKDQNIQLRLVSIDTVSPIDPSVFNAPTNLPRGPIGPGGPPAAPPLRGPQAPPQAEPQAEPQGAPHGGPQGPTQMPSAPAHP